MRIVFAKSSLTLILVMLTVTINIGCVLSVLEQNQTTGTVEKPPESIFTVVDTTDVKNPTLVSSIHLPFRSGLNNNVVLSGKYAYVTTETQLLVIDVSNPQRPSYLSSLSFPGEIGKARISEDQIIVAGSDKIFFVDISNPLQPVLKSNVSFHHSNAVREFDINESYLYVMDVNAYLHIYSVTDRNARFVEAVGIESPSSLVGVRAMGAGVEQILLEHRTDRDYGWAALSDRTDLLELSGRYEKVRVFGGYLVFSSYRYPDRDITIVWGKDQYRPVMWEWLEHYNLEANFLAHLYLTGKKTGTHGNPTNAFIESSTKIHLVTQDQQSETINFEGNRLLGPITDFQIFRKLLYVANAKGFLSIIHLDVRENPRFLSATTFQDQRPISITVGEDHVYVLAAPEDSQR